MASNPIGIAINGRLFEHGSFLSELIAHASTRSLLNKNNCDFNHTYLLSTLSK